jgi:hypothetical protein
MPLSFQATTGRCAAKGPNCQPLADEEKSGAFGTGSWTDTSPPSGCRIATKVAIGELAEIQWLAASHFERSAAQ